MLVSGQWTRQKNGFQITHERTTFFNEKSKKKTRHQIQEDFLFLLVL